MSLLDTASLVLTPNAYKEGKLYSVIPSDGSGDFTFTRATTATRVNSDGLVELVPYNLLRFSEDFSNVAWNKVQITISANAIISPDGTLTADKIESNSSSGAVEMRQNLVLIGGQSYSASIYMKKGSGDTDMNQFDVYNSSGVYVSRVTINFANGTINQSIGTGATVENVGNGWYKITASFTGYAGSNFIYIGSSGDNFASGKYVYAWGAQLVEGTTALPYQKTETRLNIPRLDYSLGGCPNILLEPQRTNLALRSEEFDNATIWTTNINGTGVNPIRTANSVISPSGVQNADTILFNRGAGNTINDRCVINQIITVATTGTYYFSCWMKATTSGDIGKQVFMRCGSSGSLQAFTLTANWVRYETTATVTSGSNQFEIGNRGTFTTPNSVSVDLWGAQLEAGSYATSYIPTTTASVTRNADALTRNNIFTNGLITAAGGTWFVELRNNISRTRDASNIGFGVGSSSALDVNALYIRQEFPTSRNSIMKRVSGSNTTLFTTSTDTAKIAIKWNGSTADVFVNGVKQVSATAFTATTLEWLVAFSTDVPKYINETALFPTPLTDAQCLALTA